MTLPLLDSKVAKQGLSTRAANALSVVEREVAAHLEMRAKVAEAWGRFEHCTGWAAIEPEKKRSCDAEDRKVSSLNERFSRSGLHLGERIEEASAEVGDGAASALARAWLSDEEARVRHATDRTAPGELDADVLEVTFELGESAVSDASGSAYRIAASQIAVTDEAGVLVRERAAIDAIATGEPDEALGLLEEARKVAKGGELTEVLFLEGQAHARRFPDGVAEAQRILEEASSSPATDRIHRVDIARALALASYRGSDFSRALAVAFEVDAGRVADPAPSAPTPSKRSAPVTKAQRTKDLEALAAKVQSNLAPSMSGELRDVLMNDGTTSSLGRLEADAVERIGLDRADLTKADPAIERRLRGELAIRALAVGDVARAASIVRDAPPAPPYRDPTRMLDAAAILCARNAHPDPAICAAMKPIEAPRRKRDDPRASPISVEEEELETARIGHPTVEQRVGALVRACTEPAFVGLRSNAPKAQPEVLEVVLEITKGPEPKVAVTTKGSARALELVASCLSAIGPARLAGIDEPLSVHVDLTNAARRWKLPSSANLLDRAASPTISP